LNELYQENFTESGAVQVVLLSKDLDIKNMASINYLTKLYIDSLNTSPEKMLLHLRKDYPNSDSYTPTTLRRTAYNFQEGKSLKLAIENLYNLIKKENYLATRILEFN
jgi:hypothetical protein